MAFWSLKARRRTESIGVDDVAPSLYPRFMELVTDSADASSPGAAPRHRVRWAVLTIIAILVLANWRLVAATIAVTAVMSIVVGMMAIAVLIRKATRPIGQLSLIDIAVVTWLYRRWEAWRAPRRTSDSSNITSIRPR
jgi:hypothetical protein